MSEGLDFNSAYLFYVRMALHLASLYENKILRTIVGTIGVLTALVIFTDTTLRGIAPLAFIFTTVMTHEALDEIYDLPEGANWSVYGASVFVVGAYLVLSYPTPWIGGLLALAGLWFVFDGVTTIRYGPSQTEHEYVSDLDDEMGEMMLRMQTLNVVYQALNDAPEPQTAPEVATEVDLTESRVESALGFLESKGRVVRVGDRYRAEPPRWGRVTPVVDFLVWIPRRFFRPFRQIATDA